MSEECPKCPVPVGAPAGCLVDVLFYFLLSSPARDAKKYKQVAGSMKEVFGVQLEVFATGQPIGTSVIVEYFILGKGSYYHAGGNRRSLYAE